MSGFDGSDIRYLNDEALWTAVESMERLQPKPRLTANRFFSPEAPRNITTASSRIDTLESAEGLGRAPATTKARCQGTFFNDNRGRHSNFVRHKDRPGHHCTAHDAARQTLNIQGAMKEELAR